MRWRAVMEYAWFPGCKAPFHLPEYLSSSHAALRVLGMPVRDVEFNCCGYPIRHHDAEAALVSAARNFALAQKAGLDILTPCKCCFGALKHALHVFQRSPVLLDRANALLAEEGLAFSGAIRVDHILSALKREIGPEAIRRAVTRPLSGLKVAAHYGCHALRPSAVTGFDDPESPRIFEDLLLALGAGPVAWPLRLECCGAPLRGRNDRVSDALMHKKIQSVRESGADVLCTACTYCQTQFRDEQRMLPGRRVPAVLFTQLLGLALGCLPESLGLYANRERWFLDQMG